MSGQLFCHLLWSQVEDLLPLAALLEDTLKGVGENQFVRDCDNECWCMCVCVCVCEGGKTTYFSLLILNQSTMVSPLLQVVPWRGEEGKEKKRGKRKGKKKKRGRDEEEDV